MISNKGKGEFSSLGNTIKCSFLLGQKSLSIQRCDLIIRKCGKCTLASAAMLSSATWQVAQISLCEPEKLRCAAQES